MSKSVKYPFSVIRQRLHEHDGEVLDFAIGETRSELPASIKTFIAENAMLATRLRRRQEVDAFCESAAAMLDREYGVQVSPDAILPAPGGRAAMSAFIASVLSPGDGVLVTEPGYPAFARLADQHHATLHAVPLDPSRGFTPDVESVLAGAIRIAAINCPNNPTGALLTEATVDILRPLLGDDGLIFNDATYGPMVYEGSPRSLLGMPGIANGLELHSFAKLFAVGPLAIAFFVGPEDHIARIRDYGDFAWTPLSSLHLNVATQCVQDTEHVRRTREFFAERIGTLRETLVNAGFEPYPTPSGQYVLCRVPELVGGTPVANANEAADLLFEKFGLAVMSWDVPPAGYIRFSTLYREEDLPKLARLF